MIEKLNIFFEQLVIYSLVHTKLVILYLGLTSELVPTGGE